MELLKIPFIEKMQALMKAVDNSENIIENPEWAPPEIHTVQGLDFKRMPVTIRDEDKFITLCSNIGNSPISIVNNKLTYDASGNLIMKTALESFLFNYEGAWIQAIQPQAINIIETKLIRLNHWLDLLGWEAYTLFFTILESRLS